MAGRIALVCGMPRSGTTWLGKIIDSHPLTDYRHEPDDRNSLPDVPLLPEPHCRYESALRNFLDSLENITDVRVCGKLPTFSKAWSSGPKAVMLKMNIVVGKLAAHAGRPLPIRRAFLSPPGEGLLVWKSVESVGRLALIATTKPDMPIVFVVRHPCGHIASVLRGSAAARFAASGDLRADTHLLDLLAQSREGRACGLTRSRLENSTREAALAWRWRIFNDSALNSVAGLPNVLVVRYDDVCSDPRVEFRRIFRHLGVEWTERNEVFLAQSVSRTSSSYYAVQKKPMTSSRRWMNELSEGQQAQIEAVVSGSSAGALFGYGTKAYSSVQRHTRDRFDLRLPSPVRSTALHP